MLINKINNKKFLFGAIIGLVLLPILFLFGPIIVNYGKTAQNTLILGHDYSGLSRSQIIDRLSHDFVLPSEVVLKGNSSDYSLNLASISASIDNNHIATSILYRRLNEGIFHYIQYFFTPKNFALAITYDEGQLGNSLSDLASQIDKPFVPTELELSGKDIKVKPGQTGLQLDRDSLKANLINNLTQGRFNDPILLSIRTVGNLPNDSTISSAQSRGKNLIGKSLTLHNDQDLSPVVVDDKTLISWLDFNGSYSSEKINDYVSYLTPSLERQPINAVLKVENNKVLEFKPATNGLTLKKDELATNILAALVNLETGSSLTASANIPFSITPPQVTNDQANNLGIKELLGRGTSTFRHSNATRNFNVEKGASIVNRILVAPGETFSFLKNLGDVSVASGYKQAYVIRAGKTELDAGGGICQVSTTLFRAMLNAGVDIISRQNHAYRVSYYEEDMPPGYDATVFIPSPDLKFINDTGHYILIQNTYDGVNKRLTYELWGTPDGRKVDISNYRRWDSQPAPPDVWIDDPTLAPGKVIQDEHAIPGLKTAFDWKVTRDGGVLRQKTFQSTYVPWAAVYRRGPQN